MIGPTPGSSSSSSTVADERLTTDAPATPVPGLDAAPGTVATRLGHEHLHAVDERRREVQRSEICFPEGTAGATNGVGDPRTVTQPVEPGSPNRSDDMDDEDDAHRRLRNSLERRSDDLRLTRRTCLRETLPDERE